MKERPSLKRRCEQASSMDLAEYPHSILVWIWTCRWDEGLHSEPPKGHQKLWSVNHPSGGPPPVFSPHWVSAGSMHGGTYPLTQAFWPKNRLEKYCDSRWLWGPQNLFRVVYDVSWVRAYTFSTLVSKHWNISKHINYTVSHMSTPIRTSAWLRVPSLLLVLSLSILLWFCLFLSSCCSVSFSLLLVLCSFCSLVVLSLWYPSSSGSVSFYIHLVSSVFRPLLIMSLSVNYSFCLFLSSSRYIHMFIHITSLYL